MGRVISLSNSAIRPASQNAPARRKPTKSRKAAAKKSERPLATTDGSNKAIAQGLLERGRLDLLLQELGFAIPATAKPEAKTAPQARPEKGLASKWRGTAERWNLVRADWSERRRARLQRQGHTQR